jgi:hypothetical protein
MCVLKGFPPGLANVDTTFFPFDVWFADANTLYVSDEGDGYAGGSDLYTHAGAQPFAGLEKWVFGTAANGLPLGQWNYVYTLQNGLGLGTAYSVTGYPVGNNPATCIVGAGDPNPNNCAVSKIWPSGSPNLAPGGLPWSPAPDGLRNLTGRVNGDGTATIWAITSTVSGSGDQGADPNRLVTITDQISATTLPAAESFTLVRAAGFGEVLRGISFTPGTH